MSSELHDCPYCGKRDCQEWQHARDEADYWYAVWEIAQSEVEQLRVESDKLREERDREQEWRIEMTRKGERGEISGWAYRAEKAEAEVERLEERFRRYEWVMGICPLCQAYRRNGHDHSCLFAAPSPVKGAGTGDKVPYTLRPGERVVPRKRSA